MTSNRFGPVWDRFNKEIDAINERVRLSRCERSHRDALTDIHLSGDIPTIPDTKFVTKGVTEMSPKHWKH